MKKFACKDLGMSCNYEINGQNDDEIVKKAGEHGQKVHHQPMTPEIEKKVRTQIKNV